MENKVKTFLEANNLTKVKLTHIVPTNIAYDDDGDEIFDAINSVFIEDNCVMAMDDRDEDECIWKFKDLTTDEQEEVLWALESGFYEPYQ